MQPRNKLYSEATLFRRWPKNIKEQDKYLFLKEIQKFIPETNLDIIPDAWVSSYGYLKKNIFTPIHSFSFNTKPSWKEKLKAEIKFNFKHHIKKKSFGRALIICDNFSNGYFHWFGDALPRLYAIQEHNIPFDTLLLPGYCKSEAYIRPSLIPFSIPSIYQLEEGERLQAQQLITLSAIAPTGNYRPHIMQGIRKIYRSYFKLQDKDTTSKIYISRAKAARRKINNEQELIPIFKKHGYEIVFMEALSFENQVRIVGNAKIVISLHGAGLTNILFMAPGTKVVEIRFPGDQHNNCYFSLADALDLEYYYLIGEESATKIDPHTDNITVDPFKLESLLNELES
jgi:hypothetical protein